MPEADEVLYPVEVAGLEHLSGPDRQVVFHGVNKSGSMAMTDVLYAGFDAAGRADEFLCTYRGVSPKRILAKLDRPGERAFLAGHYLYGAHPLHPESQVLTTGFRNPLPRVRSCYQWLRDKAAAADPDASFPSFVDWVRETRGVAHSQVEQFAIGYAEGRPAPETFDGRELLDRAIANIERDVAWFGIAEHFEESVFAMAAICGLPAVPAWKVDLRNPGRPLLAEWTDEEVEVVREVCRWDLELYAWALETFESRVAGLDLGPSLPAYQLACRDQYRDRVDLTGRPVDDGDTADLVRRLRVQAVETGQRLERGNEQVRHLQYELARTQDQLAKARVELARVRERLALARSRIKRLRAKLEVATEAPPARRWPWSRRT